MEVPDKEERSRKWSVFKTNTMYQNDNIAASVQCQYL